MSRLLILFLAGTAAPALAEARADPQAERAAPAAAPPGPSCTPQHAAMGHCTMPMASAPDPHAGHAMPATQMPPTQMPPAGKAEVSPSVAAPPCTPEHAAMRHCTMPAGSVTAKGPEERQPSPAPASPPEPDPHAGHAAPAAPADPSCPPEHAAMGHCTPAAERDIPVAPPPVQALSGPEHAADLVWDPAAMAASRRVLRREHGSMKVGKILIDRLEYAQRRGEDGYAFDGEGWWGGDVDKVWLKGEMEGGFGSGAERIEAQALWSHAIDPWFDLQLGLRHDFTPGPDRTYLAAGVQGLAPYWFEVDVAAFVSDKGELSARAEAEYDLRLTQRLILQPRVEVDLAAQDVPELGVGAGLSSGAIGLRLRYEASRQFAPYVGVEYERAFGDTADFRRAAGEQASGWSLLAGVRAWFRSGAKAGEETLTRSGVKPGCGQAFRTETGQGKQGKANSCPAFRLSWPAALL